MNQSYIVKILHGHLSDKPYTIHHDDLGFYLWQKIWSRIWQENWFNLDQNVDKYDWQDILEPWFQSVTGHHGKPPHIDFHGTPINLATFFTEEDIATACSFVEEVADRLLDIKDW